MMPSIAVLASVVVAVAVAVAADLIVPKVMIVSMFAPEAQVWHASNDLGNLSAVTIPLRGLSMLFPSVTCTNATTTTTPQTQTQNQHPVCHVTVGEGEINAAASMTALVLSPLFDLRRTYFLLSGVAGANPDRATLGSVALARYAVQVGLQYEVDPRSAPDDWDTGYVAYGRPRPHEYPSLVYGSEVFELSARLRDLAFDMVAAPSSSSSSSSSSQATTSTTATATTAASTVTSSPLLDDDVDDTQAAAARAKSLRDAYGPESAAARPPALVKCDVTTSDVYFVGDRLARAFDQTARQWTNGSASYCMSAQEDNALLEVLVRAAVAGPSSSSPEKDRLVDFSRVILIRAGANFDRPPPGTSVADFIAQAAAGHAASANINAADDDSTDDTDSDKNHHHHPGQSIALRNLYKVGLRIVRGILDGWDETFAQGVAPDNYVGDILASLGAPAPDFGTDRMRLDAQKGASAVVAPRATTRPPSLAGCTNPDQNGKNSTAQRQGQQHVVPILASRRPSRRQRQSKGSST